MIELPEAIAIAAHLNQTIRGKRIVGSVHDLSIFKEARLCQERI